MDNNLDVALVGNNYLTHLLSLSLKKKGKSAIILDDERYNLGDFFTSQLGQLDLDILKLWLKDLEGIKVEDYVSARPFLLYIGRKQVQLGNNPFSNLKELARKFPEWFKVEPAFFQTTGEGTSAQNFNTDFLKFSEFLGNQILNDFKNKKNQELLEEKIPKALLATFESFYLQYGIVDKKVTNYEVNSDFNAFNFATRAIFQQRLGISSSRLEAFHLFCSLLSPAFNLNHEGFLKKLETLYTSVGGIKRKVNLDELQVDKGLSTSFAIEGFDGMIRPKKMVFIGNRPVELREKKENSSYNCLEATVEFSHKLNETLLNNKIVFSSPIKIGTERPLWTFEHVGGNKAKMVILITQKEGRKVSFIEEIVRKIIKEDLMFLFPDSPVEVAHIEMRIGKDVLVNDFNFYSHKAPLKNIKKIMFKLIAHMVPNQGGRIKNALYFGPYDTNWLGRYSSFVVLRNWKESL